MDKTITIKGIEVNVSIEFIGYIENGEINTSGMNYILDIYSKKEEALDLIVDEYLPLYNDSWLDPESGYSAMGKEEFKKCFKFNGIAISDVEKSGSIYFTDTGVLGEHFFQVDFNQNNIPESTSMMG